MPYKMFKQGGKFCVKNEDTGESKGCSKSRAMALGHMRALYAAEGGAKMGKKELDELVIKGISDFNAEYPDDQITTHDIFDSFLIGPDDELDLEDQIIDEEEEDEEEKARADVSAADKKRAVAEYGNVKYADPANKKYPIDTEEHIRAAWSYINMPKNSGKYSSSQAAAIKRRIVSAWKSKIDKAGPPKASAKELLMNFVGSIKELLNIADEDEELTDEGETQEKECENCDDDEMMVYKDTDTDQYRWFGRYSNNFRDVDRPPEIISAQSHKAFIEKVEKGLASMPELWLWHRPEWKIGQADWLAYDDAGFALAAGTFTKGLEDVAEWLMEQKNVLMSHGMPPWSIKRDESDPSIIIEHESKEISVLPSEWAANKLTGFAVLDNGKEDSMAIPKEKKDILINKWKADPAMLERLEATNAQVAEAAKEAGIESKETKEEETVVETATTETVQTEEVKTESSPAPAPATDEFPTRHEVVEAVTAVLTPMVDRLAALELQFGELSKEIAGMKTNDDEKVKQVIESTPAASLSALIYQRVVGNPDAKVNKRDPLTDSKPKEAAPDRSIGVPFLDTMIHGKAE